MRLSLYIFLLTALLFHAASAQPPWSLTSWPTSVDSNLAIATDPDVFEGYPRAVPYPDGSILVVYADGNTGNLYQIIDRYGGFVFSEPQVLAPAFNTQYSGPANVVPDGNGGVFAIWIIIEPDPDVGMYVQRLDSLGNRLWGDTGLCLYEGFIYSGGADISSDGAGGFLYLYKVDWELRIQRFDGSAQPLWGEEGIYVCNHEPYGIMQPRVTHDDNGGACATWWDYRPPHTPPFGATYGQKFDSSGQEMWTHDGIMIDLSTGLNHTAIHDGEGGFVTLCYNEISRTDSAGHFLWTTNLTGFSNYSRIVKGDSGFYYVSFPSENWQQIKVQKVNSAGNLCWGGGTAGITMARYSGFYFSGEGYCDLVYRSPYLYGVFHFRDELPSYYSVIVAQRMDSQGTRFWGNEGTIVSRYDASWYYELNMVPDPEGIDGAAIFWAYALDDVWAKHINADGSLGGPNRRKKQEELYPQISGVSNGVIRYEIPESGRVSLDLYNLLGRHLGTLESAYRLPGSYALRMNPSGLPSGVYFARLKTDYGQAVNKILIVR